MMHTPLPAPFRSPRRASSLVIVLIGITLISILIVAFLATVRTEVQTSKVYSSGSSLKLLANSAVNLVQGQVRVATGNQSLNWASQPGMLRTFDTTGKPAAFYKLYSDASMQGTGSFDATNSTNGVPANWYSQRGVYTDLNQPVRVGTTNYFPVMSGDETDLADYSSTITGGNVKALGPVKSGRPAVEGFWLKNAPVDASSPNQVPMPVRWFYVLQDGQIIVPESSTSGGVNFSGSGAQPSAANQIVGRIAFWADDETCKVNINTASEGTFWDSPRTYTVQDYYLATRQPVQGEFQRYPGHPATVSLSTVLDLNSGTMAWKPDVPFSREDIYPLTPATKQGGSRGGTVDSSAIVTQTEIPRSVSRLYTSSDEFFFQRDVNNQQRLLNSSLLSVPTALDTAALKRSRFFLTGYSQAPDVNVFNLPRVSMWPITLDPSSGNPTMTALDKLIAFCSTVNGHGFYFQRRDPTSSSVDLPSGGSGTGLGRNRYLLEYLRTLTEKPTPGFASSTFANKYDDDRHQILTQMFDYIRATNLQDSTTGAIPYTMTFDGTLNSITYQGGKGQVVPIVDETISVTDTSGVGATHPRGFGRYPAVQQACVQFIGVADSSNAYFPAIGHSGTGYPGFSGTYATISGTSTSTRRVQAGLFLQMFDPSSGPAVTYPWYEVEISGADSLTWSHDGLTYVPMQFPASGLSRPYTLPFRTSSQLFYGGAGDYRSLAFGRGDPSLPSKYPFITPPTGKKDALTGADVTCPDMNGQIYFGGGDIVVNIFALDKNRSRVPGDPVSSSRLHFPSVIIPQPNVVSDSRPPRLFITSSTTTNLRSFYSEGGIKGRLDMDPTIGWIGAEDVIRAVVATPGDMRMIAARSNVPSSMYAGLTTLQSEYMSSTEPMSHMLRYGLAFPAYGGAGGRLAPVNYSGYKPKYDTYSIGARYNDFEFYHYNNTQATYARAKDAMVPTIGGVTQTGGIPADWDNGLGNNVDGSYINKADEGDAGSAAGKPYYQLDYGSGLPGDTFFSPNRMIPSPGMFGSLPSGVLANKPWQTLLFRPGPANHPGLGASPTPNKPPYTLPPDHLLLDLFNMPVVEPYAISTPLATAGRINMNYQIVPFTYIHRDTGLRAIMKAQMITAIPAPGGAGGLYKNYQNPNAEPGAPFNAPSTVAVRFPIDADKTLSQFESRFAGGDIFRAASEICSIDLVPVHTAAPAIPITRANMDAFWAGKPVTGDNTRERPYTNIYPLLTTKSNTYTVHYRVQSLKQVPGGDYKTWREDRDTVLGQLRGSQTIERYIDPNDTIPDYADPNVVSSSNFPPTKPLSDFYKFRVISTRQFAP